MRTLGTLKHTTKLSSAGLVYLHLGKEILSAVTGIDIEDPMLPRLYEKVYEKFIEEIDAIDNGIDQYDGHARLAIKILFYLREREESRSQSFLNEMMRTRT